MRESITVKEFEIYRIKDDSFFIQREHGHGEGMEISEETLADIIEKYFEENF